MKQVQLEDAKLVDFCLMRLKMSSSFVENNFINKSTEDCFNGLMFVAIFLCQPFKAQQVSFVL